MKVFKSALALIVCLTAGLMRAVPYEEVQKAHLRESVKKNAEYWKSEEPSTPSTGPDVFISTPKARKQAKREQKNNERTLYLQKEDELDRKYQDALLKDQEYRKTWRYRWDKARDDLYNVGSHYASRAYEGLKENNTAALDWYKSSWQEKKARAAANPGTTALAGAAAAGVVGLTVYAAYRGAMGLYNWWTKPKQLPTPSVSAQTTTQINAQDQAASAALDNATQN